MRRLVTHATPLLAAALLAWACDSGSGGSGPGTEDAVDRDGAVTSDMLEDTSAPADVAPDVPAAPLALDFRVAFTQLGRIAGENLGTSDLWLMNADGSEAASLTGFVQADDPTLNCNNSCLVDDSLSWIAVATGPQSDEGFSFQIGRISPALVVSLAKSAPLERIVDLHFAGGYLYYSRLLRTEGYSEQFEIWRANLRNPAQQENLFAFPPDDVLEGSIYRGHFQVSPDGTKVVLLQPTIRSQAVYVWQNGALDQIDYICPLWRNDQCYGAGSEYSDVDPLAISADGQRIAAFVIAGRELRVRLYDLRDLSTKPYKNLAQVSSGETYKAYICNEKEPWQFATVDSQPRFTPDGSAILYIGRSECGTAKPETDILRLDVARILDAEPIEEGDVVNLTNVPKTGGSEQVVITHFDLSPDGETVVFTGTPMFQENGEPIPASSSRHENDYDVYVQAASAGGELRQVTNDKKWQAVAPQGLPTQAGSTSGD